MPSPFASVVRSRRSSAYSSFEGASRSRLYYDWMPTNVHPDRDVQYASRDLRARARDLVKNNDYARGIVDAFQDNVIGMSGIRYQPKVLGPDREPLADVNRILRDGWKDWGYSENASVSGEESWLELQRLLIETWITDGEVFVRLHRGYDNAHAFAVEILDADYLDDTYNRPPDDRGVEIRMGVEVDRRGRRLGYHFWTRHPSSTFGGEKKRVRVPADEIVHYYLRHRPGQTRGYSLFAPALTTMKMIDGLTEAELVASRMAAAKMGWIENLTPEAIEAYAAKLAALTDEGEDPEPRYHDIAPGLTEELEPGQKFVGYDPTHPNAAFGDFMSIMWRGIARAFGMSYLTVTGDVGAANYSSMRASLLPERDRWRVFQGLVSGKIHRRVQRAWLPTAMLSGAVRLPTAIPADYDYCEWHGRGWKWVDPLKDGLAAEMDFANGLNSRQRSAAERGLDFRTLVDELKEEQEYADEAGVYIGGSKGASRKSEGRREDDGESEEGSENGNGNGRRESVSGLSRREIVALAMREE